jgi:hypothetical protein
MRKVPKQPATFKKIDSLPKDIHNTFLQILKGKRGRKEAAKFLFELGKFTNQQAAYQYITNYLAGKETENVLNSLHLTKTAFEVKEDLAKIDKELEQKILAAKSALRIAMSGEALLKRLNNFNALAEMTGLAQVQHERVLRILEQEDKIFKKTRGKEYMINGAKENIESVFTMYSKIATLQMDLGILQTKEKTEQHLHITLTPQQEDIVRRYNEQQQLSDLNIEAMSIIMEEEREGTEEVVGVDDNTDGGGNTYDN